MVNRSIETGSDFSGVGALDQALERLGIRQKKVFACDMDKYARQTYIYNFGDSINLSQPNSKTRRGRVGNQVAQTLDTGCNQSVLLGNIRRLTPLECLRLMDFNDSFKWNVSDTQAYKQAGNSICVGVLAAIIEKLKL